jgi:release factor glutamine methyltransferase
VKVSEALQWGESRLSGSGISNARMETLWILSSVCAEKNRKSMDWVLHADEKLSEEDRFRFEESLARRSLRYPLAYLLGTQDFMGIEIRTNPDALIPRPETELLAEEALKRISKLLNPRIVDVGTGSGCLAVALAKLRSDARVSAIDVSPPALELAERNAALNGVSARTKFVLSDLFANAPGPYDLIVSNPPYIKTGDLEGLQEEVRFEPRLALDGGEDGLSVIRRLAEGARSELVPGGWLLMEIGYGQSDAVLNILEEAGFIELGLVKDYSGIERVALGRKAKERVTHG